MTGSPVSEAMSDCVSNDQQQREQDAAMASGRNQSPASEEQLRTEQWIEEMRARRTPSPGAGRFWPNSNTTAAPVTQGCSRTPDDADTLGSHDSRATSKDTEAILESMTNVGG